MLKQLSYSVQFPTTGRTFSNQITFEPGLTAIVGPNEAGKSLVVEMIGYCLFGKTALRGAASDYKNLTAELSFIVGKKDIWISRLPKKEELWIDGVLSAVGAEAINKAVPALLGFGFDVFNIALVAQQDELHALTKMKPTERGKMVEKLTGETILAQTEKDCKDQVKSATNRAEAMAMMLKMPVKPEEPEDYYPSATLLTDIEAVESRNHHRRTYAAVRPPVAPVAPEPLPFSDTVADLRAYELDRLAIIREAESLRRRIDAIPDPVHSLEDIAKEEVYQEYLNEKRRRGPKPEYDMDRLHRWQHYFLAGEGVECPNCGHYFGIRQTTVPADILKETPMITEAQVREQLMRHERWADELIEPPIGPHIGNIAKEKLAHERASEREGLQHQLDQITIPDNRAADLERATDHDRELARYDERRGRYDQDLAAWNEAQTMLQMYGQEESTASLREAWSKATAYEQALVIYERESATYIEQLQAVTAEREEADGYKRGADALKLTRQQVKQELTPSLSREASKLLYAMTNGERSTIVIDEDFNVFVDNQPLATLSGSGKSVVNLALRVGLGRVLTSRVLSIFIGDEIDYAMDKERVGATQQTMRGMTEFLSQIILVTHKGIEADHTISLT